MTYQEVNALIDDFSLETFIKCREIVRTVLEKQITKILKEAIDVIDSQQTKIVILKDYNEALLTEIRKLTRSIRKLKYELEEK